MDIEIWLVRSFYMSQSIILLSATEIWVYSLCEDEMKLAIIKYYDYVKSFQEST